MADLPQVNVAEVSDKTPYEDVKKSITENRETLQRSIRQGLALLRKQVEFLTLTQKALVVENAIEADATMDNTKALESVDADTTTQIQQQIETNVILGELLQTQKQIIDLTEDEIKRRIEDQFEARSREGSIFDALRNMFSRNRNDDDDSTANGLFSGLAGLLAVLNPFRLIGGLGAGLLVGVKAFTKLLARGGALFLLFGAFKAISENEELQEKFKNLGKIFKDKIVPVFSSLVDSIAPIAARLTGSLVDNMAAALSDLADGLTKIMSGDVLGGFKTILVGDDGNGGLVNSTIRFITDSINSVFGTNLQFNGLANWVIDLERAITNWIISNTPEFLRDLLNIQTTKELREEDLIDMQSKLSDITSARREARDKAADAITAVNRLLEAGFDETSEEVQKAAAFRDQRLKIEKELMDEETRLSQLISQRKIELAKMDEYDLSIATEREIAKRRLRDLASAIQRAEEEGYTGIDGVSLDVLRQQRDELFDSLRRAGAVQGAPSFTPTDRTALQGARADQFSREVQSYAQQVMNVVSSPMAVDASQTNTYLRQAIVSPVSTKANPSPVIRNYVEKIYG